MFFLSLGIILVLGMIINLILKKISMPALIGYLIIGILIGPYMLNLIDGNILNNSADIRKVALLIILLRAGLSLNLNDLKKIGRPAILMGFIPAICEIIVIGIFGKLIFDFSYLDAFLLGSVLAAVSPAVVVPRMVEMIENNVATERGIPQLITAGSSFDDIVVIVIFNSLLQMEQGETLSVMTFINIPVSIVLGIIAGVILGFAFYFIFKKIHIRDSIKITLILGVSFLLVYLENAIANYIGFSSLIATLTIGITLLAKKEDTAHRLSAKFNKLWIVAELLLFVLVGASVDLAYLGSAFFKGTLIIAIGLIGRTIGVNLSIIGTKYDLKERTFISVAYLPKATVQAAIGGLALSAGLDCGNDILSVAVISILLTAPIGAILIDFGKKRLIKKDFNTIKS